MQQHKARMQINPKQIIVKHVSKGNVNIMEINMCFRVYIL